MVKEWGGLDEEIKKEPEMSSFFIDFYIKVLGKLSHHLPFCRGWRLYESQKRG